MEKEMKLAVLIDGENISGKYIETILGEAAALGNVIYKRIYGNWTTNQMASWKEVILENAIQPVQQYNNASGKNASDSSLIIDAMDLLYLGKLNGFVIVSSDSDFTRLAARLRESEMFVLGMGVQNTPRSFISACSKFAYLDVLYEAQHEKQEPKPQQTPKKPGARAASTKRPFRKPFGSLRWRNVTMTAGSPPDSWLPCWTGNTPTLMYATLATKSSICLWSRWECSI